MKPLALQLQILRSVLRLVLGVCGLGGCGVSANLPPHTAIDVGAEDAIVVLGVHPRLHVHIVEGTNVSHTTWEMSQPDIPKGNLAPEGEYIVIRLSPTEGAQEYGISMVWDDDDDSVPHVYACPGSSTIAFALPAGQVSYVGDVSFERGPEGTSAQLHFDFSRARGYLSANYPQLLPSLRLVPAQRKAVRNSGGGGMDCLLE